MQAHQALRVSFLVPARRPIPHGKRRAGIGRARWQTELAARRRIRAALKAFIQSANPREEREAIRKLKEAAARLEGRDLLRAQDAAADLSLAAFRSDDMGLEMRIEEFALEQEALL